MEVSRAADRGKSLCEDSEAGRRWSERPAPSFVWSVLFEHYCAVQGMRKRLSVVGPEVTGDWEGASS